MKNFSFTIICLLSLFPLKLSAQNIIRPLPQSRLYEKTLAQEVSECTGTVEISIPLFDIEMRGLTIPVSLSYRTTGIKFRQYDGEVGAGWTLNVGGFRVLRSVFGKADESSPQYDPSMLASAEKTDFFRLNAYLGSVLFPSYLYEDYQSSIVNSYYSSSDSGPDLFTFILPTASGHFVIADRKTMSVDILEGSNELVDLGKTCIELKITDGKGNKCMFGGSTDYTECSDMENVTAWMLKTLETPRGDKAVFSYEKKYKASQHGGFHANTLDIKEAARVFPGSGDPEYLDDAVDYDIQPVAGADQYNEALLSHLETSDVSLDVERSENVVQKMTLKDRHSGKTIRQIMFSYSPRESEDGHLLLTEVKITGASGTASQVYKMDYYGAPACPAPDLWGYYTSSQKTGTQHNENVDKDFFIPQIFKEWNVLSGTNTGVVRKIKNLLCGGFAWWTDKEKVSNPPHWFSLKSIITPTGGKTKYSYERNEIRGADGKRIGCGGMRIHWIESDTDGGAGGYTTTFAYDGGEENIEISVRDYLEDYMVFTLENESTMMKDLSRANHHLRLLSQPRLPEMSDYAVRYRQVERVTEFSSSSEPTGFHVISTYDIPEQYGFAGKSSYAYVRIDECGDCVSERDPVTDFWPSMSPLLVSRKYINENYGGDTVRVEKYTYEDIPAKVYPGIRIFQKMFFNNYFQKTESLWYNASDCVSCYFDYFNYKIHGGTRRLKTAYIKEETVLKNETYQYDSQNRLSTIDAEFSQDGSDNATTSISYSSDIPFMRSRHILDEVTSTTLCRNDEMQVRKQTEFSLFPNGMCLPSGEKEFRLRDDSPVESISYDIYDQYGNPLQVHTLGGEYTVYLWSYNGRYPIAEIKNARLESVLQAVRDVYAVPWIEELSAMNMYSIRGLTQVGLIRQLQSHPLLKGSLITGYTYEPFIGITSVTDSSGKTRIFGYDELGQLTSESFRPYNTLIPLKEYKYNYVESH